MFRVLTVISVIAAVAVVVMFGKQLAGQPAKSEPKTGRYPALEGLIAFAVLVGLLLLAGTGFLGSVLPGRAMSGYTIVAHFAGAGLFAVCFALLAVFRAEAYSLACPDTHGRFSTIQKICFWAIALCGIGLIMSALSAMFHLLGTHGQLLAMKIHKCFGLTALLAAIVYSGTARRRA